MLKCILEDTIERECYAEKISHEFSGAANEVFLFARVLSDGKSRHLILAVRYDKWRIYMRKPSALVYSSEAFSPCKYNHKLQCLDVFVLIYRMDFIN